VGLVLALGAGGGTAAAAQCTPGEPLENDPIAGTPHPEDTAGPFVIGCWKLAAGRVEVHGRRMKVGGGDRLCLGTPSKVVCQGRWRPPKGDSIAGTSCGGGDGVLYVEGTVTTRVRRVDIRYRDASGRTRSRRAAVVWVRGEVAEKLRAKPFGYYRGETAKGAQVIETVARDSAGRTLDRVKQTGCNRPR
jgi:hypothetical protein